MAASDYDFSQTRSQIIERAFRLIGALHLGEVLSSEMNTQGATALNALVRQWETDKVFLWRLEDISKSLVLNDVSFALSTDPAVVGIDAAWIVDTNGDDERIEVISWRQYNNIPDKDKTGKPMYIAMEPDEAPTAYVWPKCDGSYTLKYLGICKAADWDTNSSTGDFPKRWLNALTYGLAADLADEYGIPVAERRVLQGKAAQMYDQAKRSDRDRSDCSFVKGAY